MLFWYLVGLFELIYSLGGVSVLMVFGLFVVLIVFLVWCMVYWVLYCGCLMLE